jgi:hypothetical protein
MQDNILDLFSFSGRCASLDGRAVSRPTSSAMQTDAGAGNRSDLFECERCLIDVAMLPIACTSDPDVNFCFQCLCNVLPIMRAVNAREK